MFFIEIDKKVIQKFPTEVQDYQNSQHNPEQKEKFWRYHNAQIQTALQSHSNKNSMALAQKQICKPMQSSKGPRNKVTLLQSCNSP
jgi:hypothetical protein